MWLSNSSVGRKFVMALTGACLVLFVTFHCLMNAVCILWPTAYNQICEFLGANWYALVASMGLALLFIIHIFYACWLTLQNRKARGPKRYSIECTPKDVEWSSKNMLVLGIVIAAFLVVHLIQFWAKMQYVEIVGKEGVLPPTAGTLFIQEAFSCWVTPVVYIIGFIALWFHMNHGMWSMFQTVGWTNQKWIPRLKTIGKWWTSLVVLCFVLQALVFTYQARNKYYSTNPELRDQYIEMALEHAGIETPIEITYDLVAPAVAQAPIEQWRNMSEQDVQLLNAYAPDMAYQRNLILSVASLVNYLDPATVQKPQQMNLPQQPQELQEPNVMMVDESEDIVETVPAGQPNADDTTNEANNETNATK